VWSLSLVTTVAEDHNCLCELVVGTSLALSKVSLSLLSETSEHISSHNSHKILSSCRTLLHKALIASEGSQARKQRGYLDEWSLCYSLMVLKIGVQDLPVCL
jgi:hypothetical protein